MVNVKNWFYRLVSWFESSKIKLVLYIYKMIIYIEKKAEKKNTMFWLKS